MCISDWSSDVCSSDLDADVQTFEQLLALCVSDDELELGVPHLLLEVFTTAGAVDADDRGPGQCPGAEPEDELGVVLEQHPDVERLRGVTQGLGPGGARGRLTDHLVPGPGPVAVEQAGGLVAQACQEQVGDRPEAVPGRARPAADRSIGRASGGGREG